MFSQGAIRVEAVATTNLPLVTAIVAVATIGGFMFGYDSGVINGTQDGLRTTFGLSEAWLGITVSALLPGCAVGAFAAGRSADLWAADELCCRPPFSSFSVLWRPVLPIRRS